MARLEKNKVDTVAGSGPLQGNAFDALGALDITALPPGPEIPPVTAVAVIPAGKTRGRVVLRRETKDRGGKTVVVVGGFDEIPGFSAAGVETLARDLRKRLGCGGTVEKNEIIIQGDRPAAVCAFLETAGFRVVGVRE